MHFLLAFGFIYIFNDYVCPYLTPYYADRILLIKIFCFCESVMFKALEIKQKRISSYQLSTIIVEDLGIIMARNSIEEGGVLNSPVSWHNLEFEVLCYFKSEMAFLKKTYNLFSTLIRILKCLAFRYRYIRIHM